MAKINYHELLPHCRTEKQKQYVEMCIEHGSAWSASRESGVSVGTIKDSVYKVQRHKQNDSMPVALARESTLKDYRTNPDGDTLLQWQIKDNKMEARMEAFRLAIDAAIEELPRLPAVKSPRYTNKNLMNCYVITDYHIGMLSWAEETGEDWDTTIAENLLIDWFEAAIAATPDAEIGVLAQLGDYLHFDSLSAITPASGHLLDADTRYQRVVRIAIRVLRRVIDMLLHKHKRLHVLMAEGNHDTASSVWLRELFYALYEKEKRITVHREPDPYYCIEHGKTVLFFHHGHKRKPSNIDDVFVAKYREIFGRTKYAYAHMGHMHHINIKETNLMVVEQHRTLAAKDAYASRGGWLSGREANAITYHSEYGQIGRVTITPEMVK